MQFIRLASKSGLGNSVGRDIAMAVGARHRLRLPFCCWQEPHPLLPLPTRRYMILYICYTFALILS